MVKKSVYFIKHKSEAGDCFDLFHSKVFAETGLRIRKFHCDGAGEFVSNAQRARYAELGIILEFCAAYTPEQNSDAERDHRYLVEGSRSNQHGRGIPLKMWAESTNHTTYVQNRTLRSGKTQTPYELWFGKIPDLSNLRIFGSTAYFWVPDALRQKLDPKAIKGAYVGQSEEQKACRIFVEATGLTHVTRHVKVFESEPFWAQPTTVVSPAANIALPDASLIPEPSVPVPVSGTKKKTQPVALPSRKSLRGLVPKKYFPMEANPTIESFHSLAMKFLSFFLEPKNYKEAMNGPEAPLWKPVADDEISSHYKNDTWTLVPSSPGAICIPSGWDFKVKTDRLGHPSRRKARFFAKGYNQIKGLDYLDSFAPVVRLDSFRAIIAIAAGRDLEIILLDVKTAFLNGRVDEEIYIAQPEGYIVPGHETDVCRLNKSIYGICQAGRIWYKTLHDALIDFGFVQSKADPCVYFYYTKDLFVIFASWVDDGFLTGNSLTFMHSIISFLNKKFEITAVPAELFVGIVIIRDRPNKKIFLSIPQFIEKTLNRFDATNAHPVSQPVLKGTPRLSKASSPTDQAGRDYVCLSLSRVTGEHLVRSLHCTS